MACATAHAYFETHLNEISAPLGPPVAARIAAIEGQPSRTKSEKKELAALKAVAKTLAKTSSKLSQDFAELKSAAYAFAKLGTAADGYADELDVAFVRAALALQEREDTINDDRAMLASSKERAQVDSARSKAATLRAAADIATDAKTKSRVLAQAEASYTTALKLAEKLAKRTGRPLPPARLRSGDTVGPGGARMAIPRGAGTPLDGASVLFPPTAVGSPIAVTLSAGTPFVGGRDLAAGPALAVQPSNLQLNAPITVYLPYAIPEGGSAADLVVFRDDDPDAVRLTGRQIELDGTVSGQSTALGTFQPGVEAPPVGAPDGAYTVQSLAVATNAGTTTVANPPASAFDPSFSAGILVQSFNFRRDGTGSAQSGQFSIVNRGFLRAAPHHSDLFAPSFAGSYEFAWTAPAQGRFAFSFPLQLGQTALADGVASADGNVIVFTGRGPGFDFIGVGLRAGASVAADLAGRWTGTEMGVQLLDGGIEPFRTRWSSATRDFDASAAGVFTFAPTGMSFSTDTQYRTNATDPAHVQVTSSATDGAAPVTLTLGVGGALSDASGRLHGVYSKDAGVIALTTTDSTTKEIRLLVATKQPATAPAGVFEGTWNFARFETGSTTGVPDTRSSTQQFLGRTGSLSVNASLDATETLAAATRSIFSLTGNLPLTAMTWVLGGSSVGETSSTSNYTVVPDAAGNHRPVGAPVWYAVSGDGSVVLGTLTGGDANASVGIVVGVK